MLSLVICEENGERAKTVDGGPLAITLAKPGTFPPLELGPRLHRSAPAAHMRHLPRFAELERLTDHVAGLHGFTSHGEPIAPTRSWAYTILAHDQVIYRQVKQAVGDLYQPSPSN